MSTHPNTNSLISLISTEKSHDDLMLRIVESAVQGKLILVIGSGVSIGLTNGNAPSWTGLIKNGFRYGNKLGLVSDKQLESWGQQIASTDIDDLLSAAEFLGRKLGSPHHQTYARWLEEEFSLLVPSNDKLCSAIKLLADLHIPICTLNYDNLLEKITGLPTLLVGETQNAAAWVRREYSAIFHLHGSWDKPESCILGIRDYEKTISDDIRDLLQRTIAIFNHLLFIGCGDTLADPNFSATIEWLRTKYKATTLRHIALTKEDEVSLRNKDSSWHGFLEPISYGPNHQDLASFIFKHFENITPNSCNSICINTPDESEKFIRNYLDFLIRDCGQMTIEGMNADMDTGQRKFDIERLFVPLSISPCPPEFSASDPDGAAKLEQWKKNNYGEFDIGDILSRHKRLVLLALPGGGKTLLLKRLAVAYSDSQRRTASADNLPDLPLIPVLIRCREWRDHIKLPIPTMLKRIEDISGQSNLSGISDALIPYLENGKVLLLIDGLDEIHNDADRATFVDNIEAFIEQYKEIRIVITSREAGFNLVAPTISRFCEKWRLAPLSDSAITLLCQHWNKLMIGESPSAINEGLEVAETLIKNKSLRRLTENPLLLTMLLVVKHGAGGLPPDRVSLYGRAVEVLLNTWNIKGHDPLNPKEAVPQLAYVAFELMCMGKQTATENELLTLLEDAREKHPNIKRYAKDSPHDFLKRVELRSSLLLEAGFQMEAGRIVPFYQFRHLTFQEYLAAVAATDGHYQQYSKNDSVLSPLEKYLHSNEWSEVISMVAILAKKRAEPLLEELISQGNEITFVNGSTIAVREDFNNENKIQGPAGCILQCFIEEAEATPQTITNALRLIAANARGCRSANDWITLCRGPYGEELYIQARDLLICNIHPKRSWVMNSCAALAEFQKPSTYWTSQEGRSEVKELLESNSFNNNIRGLLISMGMLWNNLDSNLIGTILESINMTLIEKHLLNSNRNIWSIASWVWTNTRRRSKETTPVPHVILDKFLEHWLQFGNDRAADIIDYTIGCLAGIDRDHWTPKLNEKQILKIRETIFPHTNTDDLAPLSSRIGAYLVIAYHSKSVCSDQELLPMVNAIADYEISTLTYPNWRAIQELLNYNLKN